MAAWLFSAAPTLSNTGQVAAVWSPVKAPKPKRTTPCSCSTIASTPFLSTPHAVSAAFAHAAVVGADRHWNMLPDRSTSTNTVGTWVSSRTWNSRHSGSDPPPPPVPITAPPPPLPLAVPPPVPPAGPVAPPLPDGPGPPPEPARASSAPCPWPASAVTLLMSKQDAHSSTAPRTTSERGLVIALPFGSTPIRLEQGISHARGGAARAAVPGPGDTGGERPRAVQADVRAAARTPQNANVTRIRSRPRTSSRGNVQRRICSA